MAPPSRTPEPEDHVTEPRFARLVLEARCVLYWALCRLASKAGTAEDWLTTKAMRVDPS